MCAPLCDAVLERHDSSRVLEQLERDNLFVVALDHERRWFRYHHLFGEMLQAELERREPELVATLNGRAAAWCKANGHPEDAIEYAAAADDVDELASLVTASAFPFYRAGSGDDGRALAGDVRRRGAASAIPGHRRLRGVDPRAAWTSRRGRALGARGGEPPLRRLDARRQPGRRVGRDRARAPLQERRRADAARRRGRRQHSDGHQSVARGGHRPAGDRDPALPENSIATAPSCVFREAADAAAAGGAIWAGIVARCPAGAPRPRARRARRRGGGTGAGRGLRRRRDLLGVRRDGHPACRHGEGRDRPGPGRRAPGTRLRGPSVRDRG